MRAKSFGILLISNRDTLDHKIVRRLITAGAVAVVAMREVRIWHGVAPVNGSNDARRDVHLPESAF